jgi:hypothetical protein
VGGDQGPVIQLHIGEEPLVPLDQPAALKGGGELH